MGGSGKISGMAVNRRMVSGSVPVGKFFPNYRQKAVEKQETSPCFSRRMG